jgi:hypothetical protein
MNFFLIANNPKLDENIIKKLKIKNDDVLVFMNNAINLHKFNNFNNKKIVFLRGKGKDFYGYPKILKTENYFDEINLIYKFKPSNYMDLNIDVKNLIYINEYNFYLKYPTKENGHKNPSTGFALYKYLKEKNPKNDIVLVCFDAISNKNYKKWIGHNYEYEFIEYNKENVRMIN